MSGYPIPQGRDMMGTLGLTNPMLSRTDALLAISTKDFFSETLVRLQSVTTTKAARYWRTSGGSNTMYVGFRPDAVGGKLDIRIAANYTTTATIMPVAGQWYMIHTWVKRDADCTWHVDGAHFDDVDISAAVAVDIDGTNFACGGRVVSTYERSDIAIMRLWVLPADTTFPTEDERNQIAAERADNPWEESPTLQNWSGYGDGWLVDADHVDQDQGVGTVTNHGSAGDLTIGGGVDYEDCKVVVRTAARERPSVDWYTFKGTHEGRNAAADIGFEAGKSVLVETVYDFLNIGDNTTGYMSRIRKSASERIYIFRNTSRAVNAVFESNGVSKSCLLVPFATGRCVVHQLYDATDKEYKVLQNGDLAQTFSVLQDINLTGDCIIELGDTSGIGTPLALRAWQFDTVPTDWRAVLRQRVSNPWYTPELGDEDDPWSDGFLANYELSATAQTLDSVVVTNRAQPTTGDITISGSDTFQDSRILAIRGAV